MAPLAAPIFVLCETRTYFTPFSSTPSSRMRPTLVAIPPWASRSSRGGGQLARRLRALPLAHRGRDLLRARLLPQRDEHRLGVALEDGDARAGAGDLHLVRRD